jgi:outer membrane receptor for ferrienterochelin and colicins
LVASNPAQIEYTYRNVDNFRSIGTNANLSSGYKSFRFSVGASYMGIYNNAFEIIGKKKYNYSPELRLQSSYQIESGALKGLVFSAYFKHIGSTFGYALDGLRNVVNTSSEAYNIFDATLSRQVYQKRVSITGGVKNIFNVTTIRASNVSSSFHNAGSNTMPVSIGRSVFIQVNLKL